MCKCVETAFVVFFYSAYELKQICYIVELLLPCGFGIFLIHLRPFVVFAVSGFFKCFGCFRDTSENKSEPKLCMSSFVFCCGAEYL